MPNKNYLKNGRVLPNFFSIGVMRGGSTWLYEILKNHPDIYLCSYHKETHFFSRYYYKGLNWYSRFFPKINEAKKYKIIGEIAPTYYFQKHVPNLILKYIPKARFILILRNPVNRAFSEYKYHKLNLGFNYSFEHYLKKYPYIIRIGLYSKYLKNWFESFPRSSFLILIFEEVMKDPLNALKIISKFLDIDFNRIDEVNLTQTVNPSSFPRFPKLYELSYWFFNFFLLIGFYRLTRIFSKLKPWFYLFGEKKDDEKMNISFKDRLYLKYKEDIEELEKLLKRDLSIWKI